MEKREKCSRCQGLGDIKTGGGFVPVRVNKCPKCHGTGQVPVRKKGGE